MKSRNTDTASFNNVLRAISKLQGSKKREKNDEDVNISSDVPDIYLDCLHNMTWIQRHSAARPNHITYTIVFNVLAQAIAEGTAFINFTARLFVCIYMHL